MYNTTNPATAIAMVCLKYVGMFLNYARESSVPIQFIMSSSGQPLKNHNPLTVSSIHIHICYERLNTLSNPLFLFSLGTILVGIGFVSAIIVSILDKAGAEQLGQSDAIKEQSKRVVSVFICLYYTVPTRSKWRRYQTKIEKG